MKKERFCLDRPWLIRKNRIKDDSASKEELGALLKRTDSVWRRWRRVRPKKDGFWFCSTALTGRAPLKKTVLNDYQLFRSKWLHFKTSKVNRMKSIGLYFLRIHLRLQFFPCIFCKVKWCEKHAPILDCSTFAGCTITQGKINWQSPAQKVTQTINCAKGNSNFQIHKIRFCAFDMVRY